MSTTERDRNPDVDQEDRIDQLKRLARLAAGGAMTNWESDSLSVRQREQFWQRVVEAETAPWTTNFKQLTDAGVELPEPEALADAQLSAKLWEVIQRLAGLHVFLDETDHLSDRELYTVLWRDILREEIPALPDDPDSVCMLQLLGHGSDEDAFLYLKYYADEAWRQQWLADFPDYVMPTHEDPMFDRDRHMPQPEFAARRETTGEPGTTTPVC